jgi:hypothetical protein
MPKRSREASFSPSADPTPSSVSLSDDGEDASPSAKLKALSVDPGEEEPAAAMQCSLPPHPASLSFPSVDAFEVHYAKEHSNRCSSCGKNFPSAHFLTLHLDEHHNPLREALEARGEKTYGCFVDDCEKKCSNPQKRRLHLIDKHAFPRVYNFRVIATGIDKSTSLLRESTNRRRVSTVTAPADMATRHRRRSSQIVLNGASAQPEVPSTDASKVTTTNSDNDPDDSVKDLERSMAALQFIPPSIARQAAKKGTG